MEEKESRLYLKDVLKTANIPIISNQVCIVANFEYLKYIGKCKKFTIKARGGDIKFSFDQGQSGVNYILLGDAISYNEDVIDTSIDFVIYFQSATAGAVLEVIIWR